MIPLTQIDDHEFNLGVSKEGDTADVVKAYAELNSLESVIENNNGETSDLEVLLAALTQRCRAQEALLYEFGSDSVLPEDAIKIIKEDALCPTDEMLDEVAEIAGDIDELVETYGNYLEQSGEKFITPIPVLARYVIGTTVVNNCEEQM